MHNYNWLFSQIDDVDKILKQNRGFSIVPISEWDEWGGVEQVSVFLIKFRL